MEIVQDVILGLATTMVLWRDAAVAGLAALVIGILWYLAEVR